MAVRAYVPSEVRLVDRPIRGTRLITLYDPDSDGPSGSMTTSEPLETGLRAGPLVFVGRRDGKQWRVTLPEIDVRNASALGFEYRINGPIVEELLGEDQDRNEERGPVKKTLSDYGATF